MATKNTKKNRTTTKNNLALSHRTGPFFVFLVFFVAILGVAFSAKSLLSARFGSQLRGWRQ
jgi:hypothetical protein